MYKKGATITATFTPAPRAADSVLSIDNTDDFAVGTLITIFTAAGTTLDSEIKADLTAKNTISYTIRIP